MLIQSIDILDANHGAAVRKVQYSLHSSDVRLPGKKEDRTQAGRDAEDAEG